MLYLPIGNMAPLPWGMHASRIISGLHVSRGYISVFSPFGEGWTPYSLDGTCIMSHLTGRYAHGLPPLQGDNSRVGTCLMSLFTARYVHEHPPL